MTWYAVAYLAWACPGGWLGRLVPAAARPLVCSPRPAVELYDPARAAAARRRVSALGPPAALYACRAGRCRGPLSSWSSAVNFQELYP